MSQPFAVRLRPTSILTLAAALLCAWAGPAFAEDPPKEAPKSGFQLPSFGLPSGLFPATKKEPEKKADDGAPMPADPAKAGKEKAEADQAMQGSTAKVVEMLFSKVQGQVKVGSAVLNWAEPIVIKQVDIFDPDGAAVVTIEEVQLSKSLSQMMLNPLAPAGTKLIRPQFFVSIGKENTNIQRVLGAWFLAEIAGKDPRDTNLEIVDGHVHVVREETDEQYILTPLNFAVTPHPEKAADRKLTLSWEAPLQGGAFEMEARYRRDADVMEFSKLKGSYEPLALAADLAGRITEMSKQQKLELKGFWSYDLSVFAAMAQAKGKDVDLVGKKTEPIRIAVDIHDLASSLLAREVKANPAGGTVPPVVEPQRNPPVESPSGPQLQDPQRSRPRDEAEQVPVLPTSFRKPPIKSTAAAAPGENAENLEATPPNSTPEPERTTSTERRRHWSKAVTVETTFAWDGARWAELYIGEAVVPIRVRDGWALALPTEVPFSEGTLNLAGGVFFGGDRLELAVPAGPLLENVRLSPALCDYVLMYVAPFVAQATNIEGFFSLEIDRCLVLLEDIPNSDVRGRVLADGVRMDVSDLIQGLAYKILGGDVPVRVQMRLLNGSQTEFHFTEGRVFHEGMGIAMGDKMLYTNGSIGLDHALDLLVDLTLPFNWLPNGPVGRRLKGTRVQIPVTGTVEQPQVGKIKLPNGLGDGFNNGPLSRLLRGDPNELPPGQPPFANPPDPRMAPPGALPPPPGVLPPRPIGRGGVFDRLRNRGVLPQ